MPTKFAKGDDVRVRADKFDGEGETDELGLKFSERWLRDGNGEWCYGKITFVFKKKPRKSLECHRNTGLGIMREQ
jgi:hypothetical protein